MITGTALNTATKALLEVCSRRGVRTGDLLATAEISPVLFEKYNIRIPADKKRTIREEAQKRLGDERKINLNDDVNKYLKDFKVADTYPQPITFANLPTHTAGFDEIGSGRKTTGADKVIPLGELPKRSDDQESPSPLTASHKSFHPTRAQRASRTILRGFVRLAYYLGAGA